jgi:iron complex transport system ATP-binding protein
MSEALLSFNDLTVSLGGRAIVKSASAHFAGPGLVALVGPNGAGKTTLVKALVGVLPSVGALEIDGRPAAALNAHERARRIGYLPQGHPVHWPIPARDIVALGRYVHGARDPSRLTARDSAAVEAAMAATGALSFADRRVTELSGGERARVALARVLASETPIILADEPIAALDPRYQLAVMDLLKDLARSGRLVVLVMHDLKLAWRFADRVIAIHEGRIVADGRPEDALAPPLLERVFGVRAAVIDYAGRSLLTMLEAV